MADRMDGREKPDAGDRKGFGDDQGTRVGAPTPGKADEPGHLSGAQPRTSKTGAGSEATEGIHGADSDRDESHRTALEGKETGSARGEKEAGAQRSGSEPQESHDREHQSRYGGGSRPRES